LTKPVANVGAALTWRVLATIVLQATSFRVRAFMKDLDLGFVGKVLLGSPGVERNELTSRFHCCRTVEVLGIVLEHAGIGEGALRERRRPAGRTVDGGGPFDLELGPVALQRRVRFPAATSAFTSTMPGAGGDDRAARKHDIAEIVAAIEADRRPRVACLVNTPAFTG
jgi:hypothetical protein